LGWIGSEESNLSRGVSEKDARHMKRSNDSRILQGASCKTITFLLPLDFEQGKDREVGGHGGSNRWRRRHPRARLSWGNKRGGRGEPAVMLTRVRQAAGGRQQMDSGGWRTSRWQRRSGERLATRRGGGAAARRAGPCGGDGLLQSVLSAANRAAAVGELGTRVAAQLGAGDGGAAVQGAR
jgi:hypothetical protein